MEELRTSEPHVIVAATEQDRDRIKAYLDGHGVRSEKAKSPLPHELAGKVVATTADQSFELYAYADAVLVVPDRRGDPATYYGCEELSPAAARVAQAKIAALVGSDEHCDEIMELLGRPSRGNRRI